MSFDLLLLSAQVKRIVQKAFNMRSKVVNFHWYYLDERIINLWIAAVFMHTFGLFTSGWNAQKAYMLKLLKCFSACLSEQMIHVKKTHFKVVSVKSVILYKCAEQQATQSRRRSQLCNNAGILICCACVCVRACVFVKLWHEIAVAPWALPTWHCPLHSSMAQSQSLLKTGCVSECVISSVCVCVCAHAPTRTCAYAGKRGIQKEPTEGYKKEEEEEEENVKTSQSLIQMNSTFLDF